ncbi:ATP-binding protein [Marinilabiliaceae bacterium JC017]|nr:ATP-binding protein [Marinilabiliaceae bacterium JC017]
MNQLQRIILVNSANFNFREMQLDGNIHFIGTQGTGKSTLLRAILFFYNANSRKLGISSEKKSFSEYYFPHADSYILYEIKQEDRNFCVWLYRKQNRLCFRFIDGAYEKELVLKDNHALSESGIIVKANSLGYKVGRPIYNFTEYLDIIYGANKAERRFSLLQNQTYQNIPRTISNIFLNSSLDAGFIKKTIINSISDDSFEINLDTNRHHLETARNDYEAVTVYLKQELKAKSIVNLYAEILKQENDRKELAWKIGGTYNHNKEISRVTEENKIALSQTIQDQKSKIQKLTAQFADTKRILQGKLSVVKNDISKANQLEKEYENKKIEQVIAEYNKKSLYKQEQTQAEEQLKIVTAGLKDLEQNYRHSTQNLKNNCQQQINSITGNLNQKKEQWQQELAQLKDDFYANKEITNKEFRDKTQVQQEERQEILMSLKQLDYEIKALDQKIFFAEEKATTLEQKQKSEKEKQAWKAKKEQAEILKETLLKEGESQQRMATLESEKILQPLYQQRETLEDKLSTLDNELKSLSGSLLEFLEEEHPQWQNTIGKVIRRDVLLHSELEPRLQQGDNLYGLTLNLDHLQPVTLSKKELELDLKNSSAKLTSLNQQINDELEKAQKKKDKTTQKYNKRINEAGEQIKIAIYQYQQCEIAIEKHILHLNQIEEKQKEEKSKELDKKSLQKHQINQQLAELNTFIQELKKQEEKAIEELTRNFNAKEKSIKKNMQQSLDDTNTQIRLLQEQLQEQLEKLNEQRQRTLEEKGIDTHQIKKLEAVIGKAKLHLKKIDNHYKTIVEYEKDCNEYIHQLDAFRRRRKAIEADIDHKQTLHNKRMQLENNNLKEQTENLKKLEKELDLIKTQINSYLRFSKESLFEELRTFIEHHDKYNEASCLELIDSIRNLALAYEKNDKSLAERITELSGYFKQGNCLGFETHIIGKIQYRAYAENLTEFVREQKIIEYQTEVTRKYAMVLNNIVNETNNLLQKEGDIHKIIKKINADFKGSNFVGVVKSIEMRLQESTNKVIQVLRQIRNFQADKGISFGEINLFNQGGTGQNDKQAVELLENLLKQIGQHKSKLLQLEDAFDLEFRIRENDNDTSWVSRLANVGSNGTDVLVKSMIYINLLHIFKSNGNKLKTDTRLHCIIDEVGILHDSNVTGLIRFAEERHIHLINGSPNSHNEQDYKHIYMFRKDRTTNKTSVTKLISNAI